MVLHHLLNEAVLLEPLVGDSLLRLHDLLVVNIQLSHHLHHSSLLLHHFDNDLIEEVVRVLRHSESLHLSLGVDGSLNERLINATLGDLDVIDLSILASINELLQRSDTSLGEVIPPLTALSVMLLLQLLDVIVELLE